jgi:DNA/RNA-binding domain of Phe-tRNA-synthetase-like protein
MEFSLSPAALKLFPQLRVGIVWVRGCANRYAGDGLAALLRKEEGSLRERLTEDTLKAHPTVLAWQEAHRAFGSNPNKFQPSMQALAKRVLNGGTLPSINPLVDAYNVVSLRYLLPAGGEDFDRCEGSVTLTVAEGGEPFVELGATDNTPAEPGEVIYRDSAGAIVRKFNWREADRTKLTDHTLHAVLVLESLLPEEPLQQALADLAALVDDHVGGTTETFVLDKTNRTLDLTSNRSWEDEE